MTKLDELTPTEIEKALKAGEITLIDVREPPEFAAERIHGALLFPLSTFDPKMLPESVNRPIVFHCGSGKRSATAAMQAQAAGVPVTRHMKGGIMAWKQAKLPTIVIDPATGKVKDAPA